MKVVGEIRLGGRLFSAVNYDAITVLNEHYVMKLQRSTGLDRVLPVAGESNESYLVRLQAALIDTLQLPELLGGYLLPAGKTETDWTPEMARETAAYIAGLQDREDKAQIHALGLAVVMDFFRDGLVSVGILEGSSGKTTGPVNKRESARTAAH